MYNLEFWVFPWCCTKTCVANNHGNYWVRSQIVCVEPKLGKGAKSKVVGLQTGSNKAVRFWWRESYIGCSLWSDACLIAYKNRSTKTLTFKICKYVPKGLNFMPVKYFWLTKIFSQFFCPQFWAIFSDLYIHKIKL